LPTQEEKVEKKVEFQPFQMPEVWPGGSHLKILFKKKLNKIIKITNKKMKKQKILISV